MKLRLPLFTLDGHDPVPCESEEKWQAWMDTPARYVAKTVIGNVAILTFFLGAEHAPGDDGRYTLFETNVIAEGDLRYLCRYVTWDEAVAGHEKIVGRLRETMQQDGLDAAPAWEAVMQRDNLVA